MIIHIMDVFYVIMIATIFGFIINLETKTNMILAMIKAQQDYKSCSEELQIKEKNSLDK
mgnify:CR=1 FL=1|tara:strand:+ start:210 stop:386 length:177 start_codon:yes stop_codon:yes gene_type:complete